MPYPQDLKGKFVNSTVHAGGTLTAAQKTTLVDGLLPGQTSNFVATVYGPPPASPWKSATPGGGHLPAPTTWKSATPGGGGAPAPVSSVVDTRLNWNYTFLKYVPGAVTIAPITTPVLTGPMTGCYLCKYTKNGIPTLAHIGTYNTTGSDESIAAKTAWVNFVTALGANGVSGASPADNYTFAEIQAASLGNSAGVIAGYFLPSGEAYSVLLMPAPVNKAPLNFSTAMFQVAGVKLMTMQPWTSIAPLRTFSLEAGGSAVKDVKAFKLS